MYHFFKFLAVIYVRSYILTFNKTKLFHLFVLKMTTHFHVGGTLWERDYSVILGTAVPNSNTLKYYNYSQCRIMTSNCVSA